MKKRNSIFTIPLLILGLLLLVAFSGRESETNLSKPETGSFTDQRDGKIYKTVKIGDQVWMAENLKVTHYQNGIPIPNVYNDKKWSDTKNGAYCMELQILSF